MALELVGGALLSVAVDKLFEKLTSPAFVNFISGKKTIDEDYLLKELKMKLRRARVLLNDAEERQLEEEAVREWLDELKDVIYKAQDLVDDIDHELLSMSLERDHKSKTKTNFRKNIKTKTKVFSSFSKLGKTTAVKGEITKILKDLTLVLENDVGRDLKVFEETSTSGASSRIRVTPWPEKNQVHGRDDDKDKIIELLLSNNIWGSKIGVLPIVGMGGLGKTTLAQLIYDDNIFEEQGFQHKAWVTVSTDFDAFRIMRIILQQINPSGRDDYIDEPTILQRSLNEALKGKKFLIALDDVWDEDYNNWSVMWSTFGFGECSSRIIVTTRSKKVAWNVKTGPIYELQLLEDEHCWKIFVEHAFGGDSNADQFLEEIGRKLVDKCGGIPLAITSLGGLLRSENDPKHWEGILNNHVWKTNKILLPSLWLSYRYLPSPLKQCFTYCSVFPKDYEFEKKEMILLWMAEGYLQCDQKQKQMEEIGEEYFNNLISRSLFQRSRKPYGERFVVHDLVHDLAMFISREFCLALDDNNKSKLFSRKIRHLSFALVPDHYDHHESLKTCLCKAKNLRTFIGQGQGHLNFIPSYDGVVKELIATKSHLRVFCLCMSSLHNSIANDLKHVRYLNLSHSHIREIPCSLCTMYNLQTLLLSHCGNLNRLPKDMRRLVNLRHLETTGSGLVEMPPQMGNLKQLQTLTDFILSDTDHGSSGIRELVELQHLGGHLCISGLQNVTDVDDIVRVNLRSRKKLSDLCFEWKCDTTSTRREQFGKVLEALEPHRNLEKLTIRYYPGSSFPRWVGDSQYSRIVSVDLCGNKSCVFLPPLGQLPFLKALKLKGFDEVESMGAEVYYGNNSFGAIAPFQSLERLSIEKMAKLKKWLFVGDDDKEGGCFPRLKRLWLFHCPNTTDYLLPDGHEIESLQIEDSYKLMEYLPLNHYPRLEWLCLWDCDFVKSLPLQNFPSLKWLFLNECDHLESLIVPPKIQVQSSLVSKLELLKIDKCNKVLAQHAQWDLEGLKSLKSLVVKNCDVVLDSFPGGSLPFSLTSLELDSLSCLRSLNENTFQKLTSLESLTIRHCNELHNIPEQGLQCLSCLQSLVIRNCGVLERRYQRGKGEGWDKISHIPHISIYGMTTI